MWRSVLVCTFLFLLSAPSFFTASLFAEEIEVPYSVKPYYLVPEHSTLSITGGIAGVDYEYSVEGEYDLARFFDGRSRRGRFDNVEMVSPLLNGFPAYIDVDELLGFEGLTGGLLLPTSGPFEIYHFVGETFDNTRFNLYTAFIGPWMYLQGNSIPPRGSTDYFEYDINALARTRPSADMNGDGIVNAADYTIIRDSGGTELLDDWAAQYGERTPSADEMQLLFSSAISTATATASAVPEPSAILLLLVGFTAIGYRRRR